MRVLLDDEPQTLRPAGAIIATTGLWYHRLCRALTGPAVVGSMSRRLGAVNEDLAAQAVAAVIELPATIELLSFRTLGWPMGQLVGERARLNLLSLEALAAAHHLEAEVCLAAADDNPPLRSAASALGVPVRTIAR
ncbi:MAG: hypothetical protein AB1673_09845 [Actinomycetota bacterium]